MTKLNEKEIVEDIEIIDSCDSCDECTDNPIVLIGLYKGKEMYSECMHDISDRDNVEDDIIGNIIYMVQNNEK